MPRTSARLARIVLLVLAALAGGCGQEAPQLPASAAVTTAATGTPTPTPTPAPTPTPTPTPGASLTSYRYALNVEAINLFGSPNAAPGAQTSAPPPPVTVSIVGATAVDRQHSLTKINLGFGLLEVERRQVGSRVWNRDGNNPWMEDRLGSSSTARALGLGIDPSALLSGPSIARMQTVLRGVTGTPEQIDGQPLVRYPLTGEQLKSIVETSGSLGLPIDQLQGTTILWLRADGLPARLLLDAGTAQNARVKVDMTITDHNATGIAIEPPA